VQVVWVRGSAHVAGPGMGLAFTDDERAAALRELLGV
jgi:hypothetical protein